MRLRSLVAPAGLAAVAAAATGCGAASLDGSAVASAASKTKGQSSHVTLDSTITERGKTISLTGSGDFDDSARRGEMTVTATTVSLDEILDGTTVYLRSPRFTSELPAGKSWIKIDLQKAGKSLGLDFNAMLSQQNPTDALARLEHTGKVAKIGSETIDGVSATHYRTTIDISKLPQGDKIEQLVHPHFGPLDVWIGSDGFVHRFRMDYTATEQSVGLVHTLMTVTLSDFGEHVNVDVPSDDQVLDETNAVSQGVNGGSG
jgi:hypothetical protein